jgi:hypothetical protein
VCRFEPRFRDTAIRFVDDALLENHVEVVTGITFDGKAVNFKANFQI